MKNISGKPDTCLSRLESWFASECNGDWEHTYGITLETVDNPGWMFTVEIADTLLSGRPFTTVSERASDSDWLHCAVTDSAFRGSGGIGNLERILTLFLDWAESSEPRSEP
jgi:Immunity protein 53